MLTWSDILRISQSGNPAPDRRVEKTDAEWRSLLTDEQFQVVRFGGTERAFEGALCEAFDPGLYACVCCDTLLFDSGQKFESHSGWPSFTQPVAENSIKHIADNSHGMSRVEVQCNVCDAHLGHVFPDGPEPSGLRYCVNSLSLVKKGETVGS